VSAEAVIVAYARSPIGRANKGSLVGLRPDDLAATIVRAAMAKVPALDPREVEDLIVGCAQPAGESGYNLGRAVGLLAGLETAGTTVNRYCASSLQAIRMAAHAIRAGEGDVFVAAGVETVSRYARGKADGMPETKNPRFGTGGLPELYLAMGETAERVADAEGVTREQMDAFAARSQARAQAAIARGFFAGEVAPVTVEGPAGGAQIAADDCPRAGTTVEKLAKLEPAFRTAELGGRVTAGNACPLNDGAAALIVMSDRRARSLGIAPLGRIVATAVSALAPEQMGLGPIEASRRALARAGKRMHEIELVELNEAFAAQVIPSARALEIDEERLNVNGGAIALGHPFGMTGARLAGTLLHALAERKQRWGLATLCVGGGQGMAMVVERN
jgi:acetyl-CoA C-acetyltransferase